MQSLDIITISILIFLLLVLIVFGYIELYLHNIALSKIPIRIHVNGTRGKSSVARLIAAGLRGGGLKTYAKTTGSTPRIINDKGNDVLLHRLRSASIGEQIKLIRYFSKYNPDVLVMECMAVNPQYQWISEHKIVKSTLGVITNVRLDHLDEMGSTINEIALSLSNTIPYNSTLITSEFDSKEILEDVSKNRKTKFCLANKKIDQEYLKKMPFIEHPENISLALEVCEKVGVKKEDALNGMLKTKPDPGALFVWNIKHDNNNNKFVSAFAANDPNSTKKVWDLIVKREAGKKCVFLNTRNDRKYRTIQLVELVFSYIKPEVFIIRSEKDVKSILDKYDNDNISVKLFPMSATQKEVLNYMNTLNNHIIVGIGNIVGWGDKLIKIIQKYKS